MNIIKCTAHCLGFSLILLWLSNARAVELSMPDTTGQAGTSLQIPVTTTDLTLDSIYSLEITITYSANILSATDVIESGTLIEPWGDATFNSFAGGITIAACGTEPLSGSGILLLIEFAVDPSAYDGWWTELVFDTVIFNEGEPVPTTDNGRFTVIHTPAITISPNTTELAIGETQQFTVSGATALPISWNTTDTLIATINASGLLTGVGGGVCRVTAEDASGLVDTTGDIIVRLFAMQAPDTSATEGTVFDLPIWVTDITGLSILSGEFTLSYNSNLLNAVDVIESGTLVESWGDATYNIDDGLITVSMAGSQPLSGSGTLVYIRMEVTPDGWGGCDLALSNVGFNENIQPKLHNGHFNLIQAPEIEVTPDTAVLTVGDSLQFSVSGGGIPPYEWSTTDITVATINQAGMLYAIDGGVCRVVVLDSLGITDTSGNIWVNHVLVDIPDWGAAPGNTFLWPIKVINDVIGLDIYSIELVLSFNQNILHAIGATTTGTLSEGWGAPTVNPSPGQVIIALAGSTPLNGEGTFLFVEFEVDTGAGIGWTSWLSFANFIFNEGSPTATLSDGKFWVGIDTISPVIDSVTRWSDTTYTGPFPVDARVTDNFGFDEVWFYYRVGGDIAEWDSSTMWSMGGEWFRDTIPTQTPSDSLRIDYYLSVSDWVGNCFATDTCSFFVIKVGIEEDVSFPELFVLLPTYPNPFASRAAIGYALPRTTRVSLNIYDVLGTLVEILINEEKHPGCYEISWDAKKFPNGIYFVRFQAGDYQEVKKLILLR